MTTNKMADDAHKFTFLAQQYPEHDLTALINLLQMAAIDINVAIWAAQEMGLISEPDDKTGRVTVLKTPEVWLFGDDVHELEQTLLYAFEKLAEKENDLEEQYLAQWTASYPKHNVLIALKHLESQEKLAEYVIEDGENAYTFFSLHENKDHLWGQKQFKKNPLAKREKRSK